MRCFMSFLKYYFLNVLYAGDQEHWDTISGVPQVSPGSISTS